MAFPRKTGWQTNASMLKWETEQKEKLYRVRYYECYERYYDVSAHSRNEAEEKLKEDIANGRENPPEECYDSGAEVIGNGEIEI